MPMHIQAAATDVTINLDALLQATRQEGLIETLDNLLVTAIEGGSQYWCSHIRMKDPNAIQADKLSSPWYATAFRDEIAMIVREEEEEADPDDEDQQEQWSDLTIVEAVKALVLMAADYPQHFCNLVKGNEDAETADVWLQLAVLEDVVYG